jgi:hypothetical protein
LQHQSAADLDDDTVAVGGGASEPCEFFPKTGDVRCVAFHYVGTFGESFAKLFRIETGGTHRSHPGIKGNQDRLQ